MGIAKGMVSFLCETGKGTGFQGRVLELGKQDILCTPAEVNKILANFGYPRHALGDERIDDVQLFKALGFDTVESLDANDYEGAGVIVNLNEPVPDRLKRQYDVVYDGGTSEHIFNFPQVLRNIFDLLKPGGLVIHASPSHNHVDHGFYMFSPTVFYDFYTANRFEIVKSYVFEFKTESNDHEWLVYDYRPGSIDHMSLGGWGTDPLGIFFAARKTAASTGHIAPQQGTYLKTWARRDTPGTVSVHAGAGLATQGKSVLKRLPWLYSFIARIYGTFKSRRRPPVVARY